MPDIPRAKFFWAFHNYNDVLYDSNDRNAYNIFKELTSAEVPLMTDSRKPSEQVVTVSEEGAKLIELCLNEA